MRTTFDAVADAMYIYLTERQVARTVRVSNRIAVDLDADDNLRGVEILFVSKAMADTDFSHVRLELPHVGTVELQLPLVTS